MQGLLLLLSIAKCKFWTLSTFMFVDSVGYWWMGIWIYSIQGTHIQCLPNESVCVRGHRATKRLQVWWTGCWLGIPQVIVFKLNCHMSIFFDAVFRISNMQSLIGCLFPCFQVTGKCPYLNHGAVKQDFYFDAIVWILLLIIFAVLVKFSIWPILSCCLVWQSS